MNQSKLSAERARELLAYDPETGSLTWKVSRGRVGNGAKAGRRRPDGYLRVKVDGSDYLVHRLALALTHGHWPEGQVDHLNGDASDNRLANLRDVPQEVNQQNQRRANADSKTGLLGASPRGPRFQAAITTQGDRRYLGLFDTAEEAHQAYLTAKRQLHAGCTI